MRPTARLLLVLTLLLPVARALADEASASRLVAAIAAVRAAPERLPAVVSALRGLEGVRVEARDADALRAGADLTPELAPLLEALRELSIRGGVARLKLARPVVLAPLSDGKGALALAADASFVVRQGPGDDVALEDVRGVRVGQTPAMTLEVRRLSVTSEAGRRIARAELRLGFVRRTITRDLGPVSATEGLAGIVGR